ncbi:glycosyltransferase family protein [Maribacter sp. PR1]|uniref:Glycosyltransferase family protein n=1 Tax=Maribacter cobaltidurans TaxID=1178778 RepID=A0ABU7IPN0_9FLAO|nr:MULTISPECIES: glycosyltransferase family protein [Maribacter]MDC6387514.1 glycosyltransferase family protein [Maribacter sp. PR1]MEE1974901.1 glycosyltransferase family protein [Maribacter cobaltidurans]
MRVLYAIQGTGNGHLSRARDVIPALLREGVDLDLLVSGTQADIQIPYQVKYQCKGLSFIFGKKGGVNMWKTYLKSNSIRLQKEIKSIPIDKYDLIINDFEPVSAWACKISEKACFSFSHQSAVLSSKAPKPKKSDAIGRMILKNYAPSSHQFGLHFKAYEQGIFTPIIRDDIRKSVTKKGDHYTVYLPSYSDGKIIHFLSQIPNVKWDVFSKHNTSEIVTKNLNIRPITNEAFVDSMAKSRGVLCGAGFETPAEALFMQKKLLVVPMKGQYEQQCNAAALQAMNVPVIKSLKEKHLPKVMNWVETKNKVEVDYPDITMEIVQSLLKAPFEV